MPISGAQHSATRTCQVPASRGANLVGALLTGAQFLDCARLVVTRNWESAFREEIHGCGASIFHWML